MKIDEILEMISEYKSKMNSKSYVMFIDKETYEKVKEEINSCYCLKVIISNNLPDDTNAIVMTEEQYNRLFIEPIYGKD